MGDNTMKEGGGGGNNTTEGGRGWGWGNNY